MDCLDYGVFITPDDIRVEKEIKLAKKECKQKEKEGYLCAVVPYQDSKGRWHYKARTYVPSKKEISARKRSDALMWTSLLLGIGVLFFILFFISQTI